MSVINRRKGARDAESFWPWGRGEVKEGKIAVSPIIKWVDNKRASRLDSDLSHGWSKPKFNKKIS